MQSKRRPLLPSLKGTSHLRFKSKITLRMFDRVGRGGGGGGGMEMEKSFV